MKCCILSLWTASVALLMSGCTCGRQECRRVYEEMPPAPVTTFEVDAILSDSDIGYLSTKNSHVVMLHYLNGVLTPFVISAEHVTVQLSDTGWPQGTEGILKSHKGNMRRLQIEPSKLGYLTADPLTWPGAMIISEFMVKDATLLTARELIGNTPSFCFPLDRVAPSILTRTQGNPAHMAAVYMLGPQTCLPMVATQTGPGGNWQLFEVINWSRADSMQQQIIREPRLWWMADATRLDEFTEKVCH